MALSSSCGGQARFGTVGVVGAAVAVVVSAADEREMATEHNRNALNPKNKKKPVISDSLIVTKCIFNQSALSVGPRKIG